MHPANGWYRRDPLVARANIEPHQFRVLDGGVATHLARCLGDETKLASDPLWGSAACRTHPDAVRKCHAEYLRAGATVVTTTTYQASVAGFKKHLDCSEVDAARLFGESLRRADEAVEEELGRFAEVTVAASIGPYGACLGDGSEYRGEYAETMEEAELEKWHFDRIRHLAEAGATLLAVETIPSFKEAIGKLPKNKITRNI